MPNVELLNFPKESDRIPAYLIGNFRRIQDALALGENSNADTLDGIDSAEFLRKGYGGANAGSGRNTKRIFNLNDNLISGWYDGDSMTGAPDTNWYLVLVLAHTNGAHWQRQIAFSMTSKGPNGGAASAYSRRCNGGDPTVAGNWSAWIPFSGTDSGWITPSFTNGWQNFGGDWPVAYRKKDGVVYLRGLMSHPGGIALPSIAFVLPVGFRPGTTQGQVFSVLSNDALGRITVQGDGSVVAHFGNTNWFALAPVIFPIDESI